MKPPAVLVVTLRAVVPVSSTVTLAPPVVVPDTEKIVGAGAGGVVVPPVPVSPPPQAHSPTNGAITNSDRTNVKKPEARTLTVLGTKRPIAPFPKRSFFSRRGMAVRNSMDNPL